MGGRTFEDKGLIGALVDFYRGAVVVIISFVVGSELYAIRFILNDYTAKIPYLVRENEFSRIHYILHYKLLRRHKLFPLLLSTLDILLDTYFILIHIYCI